MKTLKSFSLIAFASKYETFKALYPAETKDGEKFNICMFFRHTPDGKLESQPVSYSEKLGELSAKEIAERKHELQVCLGDNDRYYLCASKGEEVLL